MVETLKNILPFILFLIINAISFTIGYLWHQKKLMKEIVNYNQKINDAEQQINNLKLRLMEIYRK